MGWKTFKEHFGIEHIVQVVPGKGICIGSGYCHDLVTVDLKTGKLTPNSISLIISHRKYPSLCDASPEEILKIIAAPDKFERSITVYKWDGGNIIECFCEETGWPNCTHEGEIMYDNRFSTDKAKVVGWAKRDAMLGIEAQNSHIERYKGEVKRCQDWLDEETANLAKLNADFPDIERAE